MEKETAYWLVESDEAKSEIKRLFNEGKVSLKHFASVCKGLGASSQFVKNHDGSSSEFLEFNKDPGKHWVKSKIFSDFYRPRKSTKEGKALSKTLLDAQVPPTYNFIFKAMLGTSHLFNGNGFSTPGIKKLGEIWIVEAILPDKKNKEQWQPREGLRRLKASEYWKMVEDEEDLKLIQSRRNEPTESWEKVKKEIKDAG